MGQYVARRLLQAIPMLFLISVVLFFLVNIAPGGPLAGYSQSRHINPERAEMLKRQFGLDKPLPLQYLIWLIGNDWMKVDADGDGIAESYGQRKGILRGDFGFSFQTRRPALEEIADRLPNTIYLMGVTLAVVAVLAIPIGVISAVKQYSAFDIVVTTFSFVGQAIPEFWLGLILILIFYATLNNPFTGEPLLPAGGMQTLGAEFSIWDRIRHLILPVTTGMVGWVAWYSRFLRSGMLDVLHMDYIRTARAKGLSERVVLYRHALKNAIIPLVTIFALDLPYIFAGSLYVELLFSWPGMGRLYYQAATRRDYPVLLAILIIEAGVIIISNLIADILYAYLDPRIRYDRAR
ncbi:MAG TPA: ABC transporter permease [Thermoflexia bacterium]|jgi:peptide/nickel transport system permease protein|nr:ABC transporter permease [Thermoflexia bacterium]